MKRILFTSCLILTTGASGIVHADVSPRVKAAGAGVVAGAVVAGPVGAVVGGVGGAVVGGHLQKHHHRSHHHHHGAAAQ